MARPGLGRVPAPLLEVHGVTVRFGGLTALDDVSFTAPGRQVTGVIGPNGAGKTTLLNVLCGFVRPDQGRLSFGGTGLGLRPHQLAAMGIIRTLQGVGLFRHLSVLENVMVGAQGQARSGFWSALGGLPIGKLGTQDGGGSCLMIMFGSQRNRRDKMDAKSSLSVVQRMYECFNKGDMDTIRREIFAKDLVWRLPGHNPLAGVKHGAEEVIAFFAQLRKANIQVDLIGLDSRGESTVVETHRGHGRTGDL